MVTTKSITLEDSPLIAFEAAVTTFTVGVSKLTNHIAAMGRMVRSAVSGGPQIPKHVKKFKGDDAITSGEGVNDIFISGATREETAWPLRLAANPIPPHPRSILTRGLLRFPWAISPTEIPFQSLQMVRTRPALQQPQHQP